MPKNTTLDDYFKTQDETKTQEQQPKEQNQGYCITLDMLKNIDISDIRIILGGYKNFGLKQDAIFIDKDERIQFEDRTQYRHEYSRIDWYGNMHKEYQMVEKSPQVKFLVAYVGELSDEQKALLHAERGFTTKPNVLFYELRGKVYLSGFKMINRDKDKNSPRDEEFIEYDKEIYDKLVENYNKKNEKSL